MSPRKRLRLSKPNSRAWAGQSFSIRVAPRTPIVLCTAIVLCAPDEVPLGLWEGHAEAQEDYSH